MLETRAASRASRNVVPLNKGNRRFNLPVVKGASARDLLLHTLKIGVFNCCYIFLPQSNTFAMNLPILLDVMPWVLIQMGDQIWMKWCKSLVLWVRCHALAFVTRRWPHKVRCYGMIDVISRQNPNSHVVMACNGISSYADTSTSEITILDTPTST